MGDDWNSFMQSRQVRVFLYAICTVICGFYAVGAINDLRTPENSATLVESMGLTGFYVMTTVRLLVMIWAAVAFGRMMLKAFRDEGE